MEKPNTLQDVIVGQKYVSRHFPGTVYLACLDVDRYAKFLIVLTDPENIGHKVDFAATSFAWFEFSPFVPKRANKPKNKYKVVDFQTNK